MISSWLINAILPKGGYLVNLVECYFDESGTHNDSPAMCVAGYIIEKSEALNLSHEWQVELDKYGLEYFHMVECAHGIGIFKDLPSLDRINIATRMIEIIKKRTIAGLSITVNEEEYREVVPSGCLLGSPYSFCISSILTWLRHWLDTGVSVDKTAFFFEAGHQSQKQSNGIMNDLFKDKTMREKYKYSSHTFVDKKDFMPVQAADLLAWQTYKDRINQIEGREIRKDLSSLLKHPHYFLHATKDTLSKAISNLENIPGFTDTYKTE